MKKPNPEYAALLKMGAVIDGMTPKQQVKISNAAQELREVINKHGYAGWVALAIVSMEAWIDRNEG